MNPESEDQGNSDNMASWSGSDSSQEGCVLGMRPELYSKDDEDFPIDSQPAQILRSDSEPKEYWEPNFEQQSPSELSGSGGDVSYEDDMYLSKSRESIIDSPHIQTSLSPHQHHGPESIPTPVTLSHSPSPCSSLGSAPDMTLALTLTAAERLGASNRQSAGTGSTRVDSSEEGGSSEAPPASVSFGILEEGAEQAQRWDSGSDTDLCRPDRHRARYTRKYAFYSYMLYGSEQMK